MGTAAASKTSEPPGERGQARWRSRLWWLLALTTGVGAGVGLFTFRYAEGLSYLSTDPRACVNCHIMRPQYEGWQRASHHGVAVCVDCHLPTSFIAKYYAKAENGYRHAKEFTAQSFAEPIVIQAAGKRILQDNCVRCHEDVVFAMAAGEPDGPGGVQCTHCHATVGHGDRVGLGGPLREHELRADNVRAPAQQP